MTIGKGGRLLAARTVGFLLVAGLLLLIGCGATGNGGEGAAAQDSAAAGEQDSEAAELRVRFLDVGKGDAILLRTGETSMLIDTGYDETANTVLAALREEGLERLDYLVITHFDKDHVGGADKVLEAVEVGEVLQPDYASDSTQTQEYEAALATLGTEANRVKDTMFFAFGEGTCAVYPPRQQTYEEEDNDFSLVLSLTFGSQRFLFAGDCERERLNELLDEPDLGDLHHQVLKVPHHGRKEKNSDDFLEAVAPEYAVITCSDEEQPSKKVLSLLEDLGAEIYLTSDGSVTCTTDGETLQFQQE